MASPANVPLSADLPLSELVFIGEVAEDGKNVTLRGTAESIYKQILEINPHYNPWDFKQYREHHEKQEKRDTTFRERVTPDDRQIFKRATYTCDVTWAHAETKHIVSGYKYLYSLNGHCYAEAGRCARVSCSYNAGITICNANTDRRIGIWCPTIGGEAQWIVDHCNNHLPTSEWVRGRMLKKGYDTRVGYNSC
ncbi:hypothetical protein BDZ91DRAFT_851006 [Kalaharituber pfeilii]|nr:hypothetical protein BDZ91DRAFT_851006 [Kalaharituber pfeilii]